MHCKHRSAATRWAWAALVLVMIAGGPTRASAQGQPTPGGFFDAPRQSRFATPTPAPGDAEPATRAKVVQCQRGLIIKAVGGTFRNVVGSMAIPGEWPDEQRSRVVKEDLPRGATVSYKTLEGGTGQMIVEFPTVPPGEEIRAVVTFEVELFPPPPVPTDALGFTAPEAKKLDRKLWGYLLPSPLIECDRPAVKDLSQQVAGGKTTSWEKAQTIHAWVYSNIKFVAPAELGRQNVLETIRKRTGVCAEKNSLVVALLRAEHIPARLVRISSATDFEHCYYELYLVDDQGNGCWFAGDASNAPALEPQIRKPGIVLQKGDSVTVIDPKSPRKVKQRFLETRLSGMPQTAGAKLDLKMIAQ